MQKDPSDLSGYQKWWRTGHNAERTLLARARKYREDPRYRESIKASVRRQRAKKRAALPAPTNAKTPPPRGVGAIPLSKRLHVTRVTLSRWETQEILPTLFVRDARGRKWYSEAVADILEEVVSAWRISKDRSLAGLKIRVLQGVTNLSQEEIETHERNINDR